MLFTALGKGFRFKLQFPSTWYRIIIHTTSPGEDRGCLCGDKRDEITTMIMTTTITNCDNEEEEAYDDEYGDDYLSVVQHMAYILQQG